MAHKKPLQKRKAKAKKKAKVKIKRVSPANNINTVNKNKTAIASASEPKKIKDEGSTKNETLGRVGGRQITKVRDFFVHHPDEELTPSDIAFFCKIPHNTAKTACWRLFNKGFLIQPLINHYAYKQTITAEELTSIQKAQDLKLHNIMIIVGFTQGSKTGVTPSAVPLGVTDITAKHQEKAPPQAAASKAVSPAKSIETDENSKKAMHFSVGTAEVKTFHYTRKIVIYIECTEHPLDIADFNRVIGAIEGKGYSLEGAELSRIETNVDVPDLHISGTNCIELRTFQKAWQRLYNKGNRLREEVIIRGAHIPMEEAIAALRGRQALGTNALNLETSALKKEVTELKEEKKVSNRLIGNLLNSIDKLVLRVDKMEAQKA